jgi:outer membrane protein assembly factor BamD (BamD/ComL family)
MEFGDDAKNTETKKRFYNEAVTRFSDLVSTYPDGEYAPKAQYKKALVYEKMSEFQPSLIDQASEEYVKLSYRYPEHELVADTIVRLGEYFRNKGRAMRDEAASLAERGEAVEAEKKKIQARKMFVTASQVLSRLSERFPQHNLAGKTLVVAGQAAMQGENYELAIETFEKVIEDTEMENDLRAMAMFWSGRANLELKDLEAAYVNLKKLTWDYPETDWARYARGILASNEALIRIGKDLMSQ